MCVGPPSGQAFLRLPLRVGCPSGRVPQWGFFRLPSFWLKTCSQATKRNTSRTNGTDATEILNLSI